MVEPDVSLFIVFAMLYKKLAIFGAAGLQVHNIFSSAKNLRKKWLIVDREMPCKASNPVPKCLPQILRL